MALMVAADEMRSHYILRNSLAPINYCNNVFYLNKTCDDTSLIELLNIEGKEGMIL